MSKIGQAQLDEAAKAATTAWLCAMLQIISAGESCPPELTFWKGVVDLPDGGTYLLSFMHVTGPKIRMVEEPV